VIKVAIILPVTESSTQDLGKIICDRLVELPEKETNVDTSAYGIAKIEARVESPTLDAPAMEDYIKEHFDVYEIRVHLILEEYGDWTSAIIGLKEDGSYTHGFIYLFGVPYRVQNIKGVLVKAKGKTVESDKLTSTSLHFGLASLDPTELVYEHWMTLNLTVAPVPPEEMMGIMIGQLISIIMPIMIISILIGMIRPLVKKKPEERLEYIGAV